jgi:hypothetical protein
MQTNLTLNDVLSACDACVGKYVTNTPNVSEQLKAEQAKTIQNLQEQPNAHTEPLAFNNENVQQVVTELATETCPGDELTPEDILNLSDDELLQDFNERVKNNQPFTQEDLENLRKVIAKNTTPEEAELKAQYKDKGGFESLADPKQVKKALQKDMTDKYANIENASLRKKKLVTVPSNINAAIIRETRECSDPEYVYALLMKYVSIALVNAYPRISNIAISDGYIVVDDNVIRFNVDTTVLPLQAQSYIQDDRYAFFLDWKYLAEVYKNSLTTVNIDSMEYYVANVGDTLGIGRRIGLSSLFKRFPNLLTVTIGNQTIKSDDLTKTPENTKAMQRNLGKQKRSFNIMGGYKLNVCSGTSWLQDWSTGNLKTYMTSRGDKGILRFTGGVIARGGIALIGTTLNATAHVTKGVFSAVKETFKAALTPVTEQDMK